MKELNKLNKHWKFSRIIKEPGNIMSSFKNKLGLKIKNKVRIWRRRRLKIMILSIENDQWLIKTTFKILLLKSNNFLRKKLFSEIN